jgi:hypothetical protein
MPRRKPIAAIHPFDVRHGTDTSGILFGPEIACGTEIEPEELTAYYGVAPSILETVLDHWLQDTAPKHSIERYTFLDIGAGKGRAMLLASQFPFAAVEGVELNKGLVAVAQRTSRPGSAIRTQRRLLRSLCITPTPPRIRCPMGRFSPSSFTLSKPSCCAAFCATSKASSHAVPGPSI